MVNGTIQVDGKDRPVRDGNVDNVCLGQKKTSIRIKRSDSVITESQADFERRVQAAVAEARVRHPLPVIFTYVA